MDNKGRVDHTGKIGDRFKKIHFRWYIRSFNHDDAAVVIGVLLMDFLKAFGAEFGPWPQMVIEKIETVYGTYVYEGVPNGATFALGKSFD